MLVDEPSELELGIDLLPARQLTTPCQLAGGEGHLRIQSRRKTVHCRIHCRVHRHRMLGCGLVANGMTDRWAAGGAH